MSLLHDGYAFDGVTLHGPAVLEPADAPLIVDQYFGAIGETHLGGLPFGRELSVEVIIETASNEALRQTIVAIDLRAGRLAGTLTVNFDGTDATFPRCTFRGLFPVGTPYVANPPGVVVQEGRLVWRQRG